MKEIRIPQGMNSYILIDDQSTQLLTRAVYASGMDEGSINKIDAILSALATSRLVDANDHVSLQGLRDAVTELAKGKVALKNK